MKTKNPVCVALKQLVRTFDRINLRGHRVPNAPSWSDPFTFQFEGSSEKKGVRTEAAVELGGMVHGGNTDQTLTITSNEVNFVRVPYEQYCQGFRPTEGFWFLYGAYDRVRSVIELLPEDSALEVEVYLDAGTHDQLVKHRMHADELRLKAVWKRGTRQYERIFLLDYQVSYHNSNRFGGPAR